MLSLFLLSLTAVSSIRIPLRRQARDGRVLAAFNLNNYYNVTSTQFQYYGNLTVGTPPQVLSATFDTGSSWVYLPAADCAGDCSGDTRFKSAGSSTYQSTGTSQTLYYGKGSVSGVISRDTITIGEGTPLKATSMPFVLVRSMSNLDFAKQDGLVVSGMQGMGLSEASGYPTLMDTLKAQGVIQQRVACFYLSDNDFEMHEYDEGSELVIGEVDESHASGSIQYLPLYNPTDYWSVQLNSVSLGGTAVTLSTDTAILDTGSSLIVAPVSDMYSLIQVLNTDFDCGITTQGVVACDCSKSHSQGDYPDLEFKLGGKSFTLTSDEYFKIVSNIQESGSCLTLIQVADVSFWVLGDTFLRRYYSIYDMDNARVGLAETSSAMALYAAAALSLLVL